MSIYDTLTALPLFRGISHDTMAQTVGKYRFEFKKIVSGEKIVTAHEPCRSLKFILSGTATSLMELNNGFTLSHIIKGNTVLWPEFLFGRITQYPATVEAVDSVSLLEISKVDYLEIIGSHPVFMFNYLNAISRKAQKLLDDIPTEGLIDRLAALIDIVSEPAVQNITISNSSNKIYEMFGLPRDTYNNILMELSRGNIISYFDDYKIDVVRPEKLFALRASSLS